MPAALNRTDLIAITKLEFAKLGKTLKDIDANLADKAAEADEATVKDTIAHRTHWIDLFLGWYQRGLAGESVQTPAEGYKWNQLKAYNAKVRAEMRPVPWAKVQDDFNAAHLRLLTLIEGLDDPALYTKHVYSWMNNWTLGRWAEASGASHYRSANAYIRKIIRQQRAAH